MQLMMKHRAELLRNLANGHYEKTDDGRIHFPKMGVDVGGTIYDSVNNGPWSAAPNLVVNEALNDMISDYLKSGTPPAAWYVALFSGDVTVAATWTAANFVSNATEFTNYTEAVRQTWTAGTVASQAVNNNASPAAFTLDTGGGTVRGGALISDSTKSGTSGVLYAATRFAQDRVLLAADVLSIKYALSMTSS